MTREPSTARLLFDQVMWEIARDCNCTCYDCRNVLENDGKLKLSAGTKEKTRLCVSGRVGGETDRYPPRRRCRRVYAGVGH
ncbi:unnamed protein product [Strongylus vulgaris]|uniref:Uncharacterized protein n=1 Tax=Strongylus vulgaris TaxID=40348 RepID=A0A3P7L286_STRVU|nr:unnamed protein product [Strongylus vulgaris]